MEDGRSKYLNSGRLREHTGGQSHAVRARGICSVSTSSSDGRLRLATKRRPQPFHSPISLFYITSRPPEPLLYTLPSPLSHPHHVRHQGSRLQGLYHPPPFTTTSEAHICASLSPRTSLLLSLPCSTVTMTRRRRRRSRRCVLRDIALPL